MSKIIHRSRVRGVLLGSAMTALLAGCSEPEAAAPSARGTPVQIAPATAGPALAPIAVNGLVAARDEMRLSFKAAGIVKRISVQEGEAVRKGQKLAEIEQAEVGAQVEQARQLAVKAQRDLQRGERLYADQVISLEQLEDLKTQASVNAAALRSASFNQGFATIVAPRDGSVLRKLVEERELVPAGEPVLVLGASDAGYVVKVALADRDVVQLALGDVAQIAMDAYPDRTFSGRIAQIAGGADPASGMFPIEIRIDEPGTKLVSGLVAKVTLAPSAAAGRTLTYVPIAAIVEGDRDRAFVYVAAGDRARRREVRVAFITNDSAALREGLATGTSVVTEGALFLEDQEPIRVVTGKRG